jgi:ParB family chromosome partitioning protein
MNEPDLLVHMTQQLRDKRDRVAALAALTAELGAAGTVVVPECGYWEDSETLWVTSLEKGRWGSGHGRGRKRRLLRDGPAR